MAPRRRAVTKYPSQEVLPPQPGRPTDYSEALADRICELIALGGNLNKICGIPPVPTQDTVYRWLRDFPTFAEKYSASREQRADSRSDRIDGYVMQMVSGDLDPSVARVAIHAEAWQAGRENRKRYGDKQLLEHSGTMTLEHLVAASFAKPDGSE